jgi:AcrR family transcriptional regulator
MVGYFATHGRLLPDWQRNPNRESMAPIPNKQRARTTEDREIRVQELMDAAARLLAGGTYESVTMAAVAEAAGIAKPSAYGYFRSKETLFLALTRRELAGWCAAFVDALHRSRGRRPARIVAAALAGTLAERPLLVQLFSVVHATLQANLQAQEIRDFKRFTQALLFQGATAIAERVPDIPAPQGMRFLLLAYAFVIGLGQLANPPSAVRAALDGKPEFADYAVDFRTELEATLERLLRGWADGPA